MNCPECNVDMERIEQYRCHKCGARFDRHDRSDDYKTLYENLRQQLHVFNEIYWDESMAEEDKASELKLHAEYLLATYPVFDDAESESE